MTARSDRYTRAELQRRYREKGPLTQERILELLAYDPETGLLRWKIYRRWGVSTGSIAGCLRPDGYITVCVDNTNYLAHRAIWFYVTGVWPKAFIDHKDRNKANNAWTNLRAASQAQNARNSCRSKTNKSGFKGVSWHATNKGWRATIRVEGRQLHLGTFRRPEDAHIAYMAAAEKYFGEFARTA